MDLGLDTRCILKSSIFLPRHVKGLPRPFRVELCSIHGSAPKVIIPSLVSLNSFCQPDYSHLLFHGFEEWQLLHCRYVGTGYQGLIHFCDRGVKGHPFWFMFRRPQHLRYTVSGNCVAVTVFWDQT